MSERNARMKWIRRDILPNSNTENQEITFKIETQISKSFIFQLKNVMAQSQKWATNFSKIDCFRYFELKSTFIRYFVLYNVTTHSSPNQIPYIFPFFSSWNYPSLPLNLHLTTNPRPDHPPYIFPSFIYFYHETTQGFHWPYTSLPTLDSTTHPTFSILGTSGGVAVGRR